jgi:hypothetical protein
MNEISTMLDSGFRRNDGFGCFLDFFSNLSRQKDENARTSRVAEKFFPFSLREKVRACPREGGG